MVSREVVSWTVILRLSQQRKGISMTQEILPILYGTRRMVNLSPFQHKEIGAEKEVPGDPSRSCITYLAVLHLLI